MAQGAYHGAHAWVTPVPHGVMPEDRANMVYSSYNDLASLTQVVEENRGKMAGPIISRFRHDAGHDSELPVDGFLSSARKLCDDSGMVFILDDVRAGFRLHLGRLGRTVWRAA